MDTVELPRPETDGAVSVERAIESRASRREFSSDPVDIEDVAQLLWAAQGLTHERDEISMRAAPSAGATYPLVADLEITRDGCEGVDAGLYRYDPDRHALDPRRERSIHETVTSASLDQAVIADAPAVIALSADFDRTTGKYPEHGERYVHMEAGHVAQNVQLVCESQELNSCPVGAFDDGALSDALALSAEFEPLYLVPFGRRSET